MDENKDFNTANEETVELTEQPYEQPKKSTSREVFEWISSIVIALVIAFLLRNFVITFVRVDGESMLPTLVNNERLIVIRLGYTPKQGDVVILDPPNGRGPYVKRVIGMPGQTVTINNGSVYIDGELQEEDYVNNPTFPMSGQSEFVVPEGSVFVLGDNREHSHDSRSEDVGFIKKEKVLGKVVCRVWPLNKFGSIEK